LLIPLDVNVIVNGSTVATLKVGVRRIDLTVFELVAEIVGTETVSAIMTAA